MLFTSSIFLFIFLPISLLGFFISGRFYSARMASLWLFIMSLVFYGYWMPKFTLLLLASIITNYTIAQKILSLKQENSLQISKKWLIFGICFNIALLIYYKYTNFFIDNLNFLFKINWKIEKIILPIGISFFTFTQIAFLADIFSKNISKSTFFHYGLFVTYFPHLIAGPVLHHAQMMPQFEGEKTYHFNTANFTTGMTIFTIGLFKKIVMADGISPYADAIFNAAETATVISFNEGWIAAFAYTFQLYFDFSGYSDMAIGLSLLFNIKLPYNFNSPYKSKNIIDFWRRWHISLSSFLRDYLYIPLGGNRKGPVRHRINLLATMVLGGLWHGASWNFVIWGSLHGLFLVINNLFQTFTKEKTGTVFTSTAFNYFCVFLTFILVVLSWVFFRANTLDGAIRVLQAMHDFSSFKTLQELHPVFANEGLVPQTGILGCSLLAVIAFILPNSNWITEKSLTYFGKSSKCSSFSLGMITTLAVFLVLINSFRSSISAFIYFNF